jgi:hypothetical protein
MNWILGVIAITTLLGLGWGWFYFIKGHVLPPATEIREISISYNENIGDLLPDDYDSKEFVLKSAEEIIRVLEKLEGVPISRVPLINGENMVQGPNWILNIYFENGEFRFICVDKEYVSGNIFKNSELYQYLKGHYSS